MQAHFRVSSWRLDPGAVGVGGAVALCRVGSCRSPEAAAQGSCVMPTRMPLKNWNFSCRNDMVCSCMFPLIIGSKDKLKLNRCAWFSTSLVTSPFPNTALTDHHLFFPVTRYRLRVQATELFHVGPFYTRQFLELLQIKEVPVRVARTLAVDLILLVCLFVCFFVCVFGDFEFRNL